MNLIGWAMVHYLGKAACIDGLKKCPYALISHSGQTTQSNNTNLDCKWTHERHDIRHVFEFLLSVLVILGLDFIPPSRDTQIKGGLVGSLEILKASC